MCTSLIPLLEGLSVKTAGTPIETKKPLVKDEEAVDVLCLFYAGANLDWKSITGGCRFLNRRLISWQCKKQTIIATLTTEVEYVAAKLCTTSTQVNTDRLGLCCSTMFQNGYVAYIG
nr:putative ribonuclease H-like domain-containing protein [Tanacetum cinerariifolium]